MKKTIVLAVIFAGFILLPRAAALGQVNMYDWNSMTDYLTGNGFSQENLQDIKDAIYNRSSPIIKSVELRPENPVAGQPVTVTAVIVTPPRMGGDDISDAYINFSTDGGKTMSRIDMDQDSVDPRVWTGAIPGQPSGTELIFGLQADNVYNETSVESLCETVNFPQNDDNVISAICNDSVAPELCDAQAIHGCMLPTSVSPDDYDLYEDSAKTAPDDLRIKTARIGFNSDKMLFDVAIKGQVTPGRMSPADIHIYVAGWLNPDKGGGEQGLDTILNQGAVALYAPLNPTYKCALYYFLAGTSVNIDNESVTCDATGSHLLLTVKHRMFEPNPSKSLEFVFMTFTMWQISPAVVKLDDMTQFTRVYFTNRGFRVP